MSNVYILFFEIQYGKCEAIPYDLVYSEVAVQICNYYLIFHSDLIT
jgi:hypothetical protein